MTSPRSLRERAAGSNPKAVEEAEKKRRLEQAEAQKAGARDRELAKWFDTYGAKKPMKVFEATVCAEEEVTEDTEFGTRTSDGTDYSTDYAIFGLKDVECFEGSEADSIRFRLPEDGKDWSQYAEGSVMVRESNLTDIFSLCGARWRFEGDWMPSFTNKNGFWQGTYFYRVTQIGAAAVPVKKEVAAADIEALALSLVGKEPAAVKKMDLLKWVSQNEKSMEDAVALNGFLTDSKTNFVEYVSSQGLIAVGEDGKLVNPVGE